MEPKNQDFWWFSVCFGSRVRRGKWDQMGQMASRAYSITPYCQIPGTRKSSILAPGARKAGILASWQLGMGIMALQEAKMCTESPKISILGCQNVDFLMFLVPCQHSANVANNILSWHVGCFAAWSSQGVIFMILAIPHKQGNPGKRDQILQMASRAKAVLLHTARYQALRCQVSCCQVPGSVASWHIDSSVWALWHSRKPRCALRLPKYRFWIQKYRLFWWFWYHANMVEM